MSGEFRIFYCVIVSLHSVCSLSLYSTYSMCAQYVQNVSTVCTICVQQSQYVCTVCTECKYSVYNMCTAITVRMCVQYVHTVCYTYGTLCAFKLQFSRLQCENSIRGKVCEHTYVHTYVGMSPIAHTKRMQLTLLKMCVIMHVIILIMIMMLISHNENNDNVMLTSWLPEQNVHC